jgi:hypothetical protein
MPTNTDIKIDISLSYKKYTLTDNQIFFIINIDSKKYSNFHYQIVSIINNNREINLKNLEEKLRDSISIIKTAENQIFNDKFDFLSFLTTSLKFDEKSTKLVELKHNKEHYFKLNEECSKVIQDFDKNSSTLFITDSFQNKRKKFYLGYELPKDLEKNTPLCSISILSGEKLTEKIYLFPTKSSLDDVRNLLNSASVNLDKLKNLNIPYVRNIDLYSKNELYNYDIQFRINLQTIISEEIIRLEQDTRESAKKKIGAFIAISRKISEKNSLEQIRNFLDKEDSDSVKKILSEHRDRLSFFINTFFKFKTHSERTIEDLRKMLP